MFAPRFNGLPDHPNESGAAVPCSSQLSNLGYPHSRNRPTKARHVLSVIGPNVLSQLTIMLHSVPTLNPPQRERAVLPKVYKDLLRYSFDVFLNL